MEREIKFRGQTISGDWVTGNLAVLKEKLTGFNLVEKGSYISNTAGAPFAYQVRPETVGQFTGLTDKNSKEIYEGDVIQKIQYSRPFSKSKKGCIVRYIVKWDSINIADTDHNNEVLSKDPSSFNECPGFIGKQIYNEKGYQCHGWSEFANCEVIGNIHENPELLNQKGESL